MSRFLLDTNIPSELTREQPAPQVERWLDGILVSWTHSPDQRARNVKDFAGLGASVVNPWDGA